MSNEHETQKEIRGILRLLETTARVIETSPIVDPSEGEERCAQQVNNALNRLSELGAAHPGLFQPLETGASFGEISVACHQVAAYVREDCADDFDFEHVKKTIGDELKDVSEAVRQSMPSSSKMCGVDKRKKIPIVMQLRQLKLPRMRMKTQNQRHLLSNVLPDLKVRWRRLWRSSKRSEHNKLSRTRNFKTRHVGESRQAIPNIRCYR